MLACLLAACTLAAPAAAAAPAVSQVQFRLSDPRLDEVSGIAAGIASPGVVYVQNDGGDAARFFALAARTGAVRAVYTVPGARNVDWEDIAVAPDAAGTPSVWLADIGDNDARRRSVQIYRVDEPRVDPSDHGAELRTAPAQVWNVSYPDGPHNAESLAVSGRGVPYIITKSLLGTSAVYAARSTPGESVLRRVGTIQFRITDTPGPFPPAGQLAATGADLSRDGSVLVVRTYTDAYFWRVDDADVASALQAAPIRVGLPRQPQGEGICLRHGRVLIDSEQAGSAVHSLPVPPAAKPIPAPSTSAAPEPAATHSRPSPSLSAATAPPGGDAGDHDRSRDGEDVPDWAFALIGVGVAATFAAVLRIRRRP